MQYRAVRPIDAQEVIPAEGDTPAKRCRAYAIGDTLDRSEDPAVVKALCDRNLAVGVNLPDAPVVDGGADGPLPPRSKSA